MNERVKVQAGEVHGAFKLFADALQDRIKEKGDGSFISLNEIKGAVGGEVYELEMAVHAKDETQTIAELLDIAVGSIFGIASIMANRRAALAEKLEKKK